MKYEIEINGRQVALDLDHRDDSVFVVIEGRGYNLEVVQPQPGVYLFFKDGDVYEARVFDGERGSLSVSIGGSAYQVSVIDRKHRRPGAEQSQEGRQQITAPMPGKVVRVLLNAGDEVGAGQGIVVVEAMKMQNEVKASRPGRVAEIRVAEGATVTANQILAIVE